MPNKLHIYIAVMCIVSPSECRALMDLYLVVDGSDSISASEFQTLREALVSLIEGMDMGPQKARVGINVFSSGVVQESNFMDNKMLAKGFANNLVHPRDSTWTWTGIQVGANTRSVIH